MIAAIVPAAGRSERMGRPKLILPLGGTTVIARVVTALRLGGAEPVIVVAPPAEAPHAARLADQAAAAGALVVVAPGATADMRASVELGLARLRQGPPPATVLLAPGDSPGMTTELVARIIAEAGTRPSVIVVPAARGRRGHPVALPWSLAARIPDLAPGAGVNALLAAHAATVVELEVDNSAVAADLDTPADYRRWSGTDPPRC
jgi:molybdenum cofactor cytidylyltransferase